VAETRQRVRWLDEPEDKDYAAARSYLSLLIAPGDLDGIVGRLRVAALGEWRAKDVLRAAQLPLLGPKHSEEVAEKLAKVRDKQALSPILIVVFEPHGRIQIADGYHRTCAAFLAHEDTYVPGRILFA